MLTQSLNTGLEAEGAPWVHAQEHEETATQQPTAVLASHIGTCTLPHLFTIATVEDAAPRSHEEEGLLRMLADKAEEDLILGQHLAIGFTIEIEVDVS